MTTKPPKFSLVAWHLEGSPCQEGASSPPQLPVISPADLLKKAEIDVFLDVESREVLEGYAALFKSVEVHDPARVREFALTPLLLAAQKLLRLYANPPPRLRSKFNALRRPLPGIERITPLVQFLEAHEDCAEHLRLNLT